MTVIIRLQNLPWSANALDIRQFFKRLSIPDGGVHIVGGELGDAFIAFSTDEDARQAMMRDRQQINGVQIRLLLSSRAEMQKVIESARQQTLQIRKNTATLPPLVAPPAVVITGSPTIIADRPAQILQPPVINANTLDNILSNNVIAKQTTLPANIPKLALPLTTPSPTIQRLNTDTISIRSDQRRSRSRDGGRSYSRSRSRSRSRGRSNTRRRHGRSRSRSRDRDWYRSRRSSGNRRSRERSRGSSTERKRDRSKEHSQDRKWQSRNNRDYDNHNNRSQASNSRSSDAESKSKLSHISPWSVPLLNTGQNTYTMEEAKLNGQISNDTIQRMALDPAQAIATGVVVPAFPGSSNALALPSANNSNIYNLKQLWSNSISKDTSRRYTLQNPYTALNNNPKNLQHPQNCNNNSNAIVPLLGSNTFAPPTLCSQSNDQQEAIGFANTNPYEKIYPSLFAQAAALSSTSSKQAGGSADNTIAKDNIIDKDNPNDSTCVKISNMWAGTTYSDLRKFLTGLFIPHNGIKLINDKHGARIGVAYIQFSRSSSVSKALCRNNSTLKNKVIKVEIVSEEEFEKAEDSYRPVQREKSQQVGDNETNSNNNREKEDETAAECQKSKNTKYNVLYIEDIPTLATEQDIMKMFSSYTLYDILLISNPANRREFIAYVRFSLEEDAKAAFEDKSRHQIGYRRVRVRPGTIDDMERAKEKIRLANEQLKKEEEELASEASNPKQIKLDDTQNSTESDKVEKVDLTRDDDDTENSAISINDNDKNDISDNIITISDKNDTSPPNMALDVGKQNGTNNADTKSNDNTKKDKEKNGKSLSKGNNAKQCQKQNSDGTTTGHKGTNAKHKESSNRFSSPSDPRLRRKQHESPDKAKSNYNIFNPNFNNNQHHNAIAQFYAGNNFEKNFIILKNCDYSTRISDVAQLLLSANLALKHIELLRNDRQLPTGEFIVEFRKTIDAQTAVKNFHNIQFGNRGLRVYPITPQEIADRLCKPFLNYIPGGNGYRIGDASKTAANNHNNYGGSLIGNGNTGSGSSSCMPAIRYNNNNNSHHNNSNVAGGNVRGAFNMSRNTKTPYNGGPLRNQDRRDDGNDDITYDDIPISNNNIPEKFHRNGCVLALENVPYKAQISDIINFFSDFDIRPDDVIRRFNDDGTPTGDARVAFRTADAARAAFSTKRRSLMQKRIHITII